MKNKVNSFVIADHNKCEDANYVKLHVRMYTAKMKKLEKL